MYVSFNDNACVTKRVIDGTVTAFITLKRKLIPTFQKNHVYAVLQPYKDLPPELVKDIPKTHPGFSVKRSVKPMIMPHHIRVTSVRSFRLNDITEDDMMKVGVERDGDIFVNGIPNRKYSTARRAFTSFIAETEDRFIWRINPFVWLFEFELID